MNTKFIVRLFAVLLIILGGGVAVYAVFRNSDKVDQNIVFTDRTMLEGLWNDYKEIYWESGSGRTLDKQQNDITTSEGQSYTMLRAVWQSDKPTFDKTWQWTKEHLQREDKIFSWKWGKNADGTYGVLTDQGGENAAADADSDIALALLMAASRWQRQSYYEEARVIIPALWEKEVITAAGKPYLASNNLEKAAKDDALINVSYFSPYAYRIFATVDKKHDWNMLVNSSYELLNRAIDEPLDKPRSAQLPPDWISISKSSGRISAPQGSINLTTNYGYDAMRVSWRMALDYMWNKDPRAKSVLNKMSFVREQWQDEGTLYSVYGHDGTVVTADEVAEAYAAALANFMVTNPSTATKVYDEKLKRLYNQNANAWSGEMTYYGDNWVWFAIALHDNHLENLAAQLQ